MTVRDEKWFALQHEAAKFAAIEKMRVASELRLWQYKEREFPPELVEPLVVAMAGLRSSERKLERECAAIVSDTPEGDWFEAVPGFGASWTYTFGQLPIQPGDYDTVSGLWKTFGLHVHEGRAVKRKAGDSGSHQRFRQVLRGFILYRVTLPHIKMNGGEDKNGRTLRRSPYRDVYDVRRERTMETHPPMLDEGEGCEHCDLAYSKTREKREASHQQRDRKTVAFDCANLGGVHWTDGHRHADALRVTGKAIIRDVYRIWNGQEARFVGEGGQYGLDDQSWTAALARAS